MRTKDLQETVSTHVGFSRLGRSRGVIFWGFLLIVGPAMLWLLARAFVPAWLAVVSPWLCPAGVLSASSLLAALVAYPVLEEFLFRRVLCEYFERLLRRGTAATGPLSVPALGANLLSSLLFGAAHVAVHGLLHGLAVILPSLVLGAVYLRHRNLLLNTGLHTYWNGLVLFFCR